MTNFDLYSLVSPSPMLIMGLLLLFSSLGSKPRCEGLGRVEMLLTIAQYLRRGNHRRLIDGCAKLN